MSSNNSRAARLVERLEVTVNEWTPKANAEHDKWVAKSSTAEQRDRQQTHQGNLRWSGDKEDRSSDKGTTRPRSPK